MVFYKIFLVALLWTNSVCFPARAGDNKHIKKRGDTVVVTGKVDPAFNSFGVDVLDPFSGRKFSKETLTYQFNKRDHSFKVSFTIDKPQVMLFMLKEVWVTPGDSINITFKVLENTSKRWRDTLIASGPYQGNYSYYPFFRDEYRYNDKNFPNYYLDKSYHGQLLKYKQDLKNYYANKSKALDKFIKGNACTAQAAERIKKDLYYQYLLDLAMPYEFKLVKKENFPTTYFDDFQENLFKDENEFESRYYSLAFKLFHRLVADDEATEWFTPTHFKHLYDHTKLYSGLTKDFLQWSDIDWFSRNKNFSFTGEMNRMYQEILDQILSVEFRERILSSGFNEKGSISPELANVELLDINSKAIKLGELFKKYKGKIIYMDFWASWCKPCRQEFPFSLTLSKNYKSAPIEFVYISQDQQVENWKKAVKTENLDSSKCFILSSKNDLEVITKEFKFTAIPHYSLIRKNGSVAYSNAPRPSAEADLAEKIRILLKEPVEDRTSAGAPPPKPGN